MRNGVGGVAADEARGGCRVSGVAIKGLEKRFGDSLAVKGIDLTIKQGEFVTLLGPSGCGKTTTLRCLAGLEVPTGGQLEIGERTVFSTRDGVYVPPERRGIGMVFQSYALWPHMTVRSTVAYPLKLMKVPRAEADRTVAEILDRVALSTRAGDAAVSLSGGQQQRVALARAMVNKPAVILFDEPLSNLDVKLRNSMRSQIRELHDELGTTSVYVTHDQEEAIALADRVVVMNEGRIEQVGTPREVYTRPNNAFVADFMGFQNVLPARVVSVADDEAVVELQGIPGARLVVDEADAPGVDDSLLIAFRASHVEVRALRGEAEAPQGTIAGRIRYATYLGSALRLLVDTGDRVVRAQIDERDFGRFGPDDLAPGRSVALLVSPQHIVGLPAPGQPGHTDPASSTMTVRVPA